MQIDLSDVPESTVLAVHRLVELSRRGHSGTVMVDMNSGGVGTIREGYQDQTYDSEDLKQLAKRERLRVPP